MKVKFNFRGQVNEGVVIDSYNSDYDGRKMFVVKCDEKGAVIENVPADCCKEIKEVKNAKLAFLAWQLKMKLDVQKDSISTPFNNSEFIRAYDQGKQRVLEDVYEIAEQILEIANQNSSVKFMEEDVDLSGNLGQVVDEYA